VGIYPEMEEWRNAHAPMLALVLTLTLLPYSDSLEFDSSGRAIRNPLGTLYTLRNKLGNNGRTTGGGSTIPPITTVAQPPLAQLTPSRGYPFHHSPLEITPPNYAQFQNRMGRVSDEPIPRRSMPKPKGSIKWKKAKKGLRNEGSVANSFNVHRPFEVTEILLPGNVTAAMELGSGNELSATSRAPPLSSPLPPTTPPSTLSQIQSIGQGISQAMTTILTRKLMKILDQDVPPGIFTPLKHLVASGNEMVEYWDKRTNARDGENPGIVEMLGYGLEELKKFRDGHAIKASDPVANLTSPSRALIEGIVTVKRLTNRVLGYGTSNEIVGRGGGYGHDSYGHHGHMSYG